MQKGFYILFFFALIHLSNCKDLPTFDDPGYNNPQSPHYVVRPVNSLEIQRNTYSKTAHLNFTVNTWFPYSGILVEVQNKASDDEFMTFTTIPKQGSRRDSLYDVQLPEPPFISNKLRVRSFYVNEGIKKYSEPRFIDLDQTLYDFNIVFQENEEVLFYFKNDFVSQINCRIIYEGADSSLDTLYNDYLYDYYTLLYLDNSDSYVSNAQQLYYQLETSSESTSLIPINFE
jgi:hypothetical protein